MGLDQLWTMFLIYGLVGAASIIVELYWQYRQRCRKANAGEVEAAEPSTKKQGYTTMEDSLEGLHKKIEDVLKAVAEKEPTTKGDVGGHVFIANSSVLAVHCDAFLCPGFNGYSRKRQFADWKWSVCGEGEPT